jgi:hypothetical protein
MPKVEDKKVDVTKQEQLEFVAHLESRKKSMSYKWKDIKRNVSSPEASIKMYERSEKTSGTLLGRISFPLTFFQDNPNTNTWF